MRKEQKKNRQSPILIIALVAVFVVIAALVAVIVVLLNREPEVQLIPGPGRGGYVREPGGRGFLVTEENVEEVRAEMEARQDRLQPEDAHFEFSMVTRWTFPTALTPSPDALVRNVVRNSRMIFFDVYIEEFGVVYVSPFMPLGSAHRGFALEEDLPAGVYSAVVTHFLVDDDLEILTDVSVGVTITVQN